MKYGPIVEGWPIDAEDREAIELGIVEATAVARWKGLQLLRSAQTTFTLEERAQIACAAGCLVNVKVARNKTGAYDIRITPSLHINVTRREGRVYVVESELPLH